MTLPRYKSQNNPIHAHSNQTRLVIACLRASSMKILAIKDFNGGVADYCNKTNTEKTKDSPKHPRNMRYIVICATKVQSSSN